MYLQYKRKIIKEVLSKLGQETSEIAIANASWAWFRDGRSFSSGLRLNPNGYDRFVESGHKFYCIQLNEPLQSLLYPSKFYLGLQDKIKHPWYLEQNHIFVSSESEAAWITLVGGDLKLLNY